MKVGAPKETFPGENRVAMTPSSALDLQKLGHSCFIQSGAGLEAGFSDKAYEEAGVTVVTEESQLWNDAEVVVKVRPPTEAEVKLL